jgi:hypothetical protein
MSEDENPQKGTTMTEAKTHTLDALRAASTRIVMAVGTQSSQAMAGRAAVAVAGRLGTEPVTFPGGHDGFLGGEYGGMGSRTPSPPPCARSSPTDGRVQMHTGHTYSPVKLDR